MLIHRRSSRSIQQPSPRDPTKFPTTQLALLALVRAAEPIALTSVFPYAWKLVLSFHFGARSDASFYAGLLIAAFALAESLTGMFWGGLSDRLGRKPILLFGCVGTVLSLLTVGFSTNFWMALFGRALGGLLNGNIGVIQTMVGELVTRPEHEPRAYAVMPFVWSIGTIIGPAIGGYFSNPSENFPNTFSRDGLFGRFPYLLPNLICAALLVVAIIVGIFLIEETHPEKQRWSQQEVMGRRDSTADTPLFANAGSTATAGAMGNAPADISRESYGTFNAVDSPDEHAVNLRSDGHEPYQNQISSGKARGSIFSRRVVMLVTALGIFTYHSMTYDNLLPIFLQDSRQGDDISSLSTSEVLAGGLGLSTQQVGIIMSVNGIIALAVQGIIFPLAATWLGVWKLFILVTCGHPIAYFIVPYLAFLPESALYPGIYACLTIRNLFSILAYPVLLILIKEASPGPSYLGRINGLAASVGAACRTLASPIAGALYCIGIKIDFTPLAWWASALVAVIGAIQLFFIRRYKDTVRVQDVSHFQDNERSKEAEEGETVHFYVCDTESSEENSEVSSEACESDGEEQQPLLARRERGHGS